jgi:enamine deaminase RidA (YjgF/YER057c/UK114 family)
VSVREGAAREGGAEITPEGWPRGIGYAHGVSARGRVVTVAGQVGWEPRTGEWIARDLPGQTAQTLRNIAAVLEAAHCSVHDVVRLTWFVLDRDAYAAARREIGDAYRSVFGRHYPAMSVVVVAALIEPEALVEIEATAVVPE